MGLREGKVHIVGAGLAGLAAAVRLAGQGHPVAVYEGAGQAGGRCRSYVDAKLDCLIDNGNHLLMSANHAALTFLREADAQDSLIGPARASYPFFNLETGARWRLRPNRGPVPYWLLDRSRRVPDTKLADYWPGVRIAAAGPDRTVADLVPTSGPLFKAFWEPLTLAALNTTPEKGSARLLWAVLRETFARGEASCRPLIARDGLGESFVRPALTFLERRHAPLAFNRRVRRLVMNGKRVVALDFGTSQESVGDHDSVILAVRASQAAAIVPGLTVPDEGETIVNAHYRLPEAVVPPDGQPVLGLVNARAHWIFMRGDIVSLTISAAGALADEPAESLLPALWAETARALQLEHLPEPPGRLIKEKRATFDQSPEGVARRPGPETSIANLVLAGDWTDTGLPATIEGAIRSGHRAAALAPRFARRA
jgi:hydroxysqualene dehydroxylase